MSVSRDLPCTVCGVVKNGNGKVVTGGVVTGYDPAVTIKSYVLPNGGYIMWHPPGKFSFEYTWPDADYVEGVRSAELQLPGMGIVEWNPVTDFTYVHGNVVNFEDDPHDAAGGEPYPYGYMCVRKFLVPGVPKNFYDLKFPIDEDGDYGFTFPKKLGSYDHDLMYHHPSSNGPVLWGPTFTLNLLANGDAEMNFDCGANCLENV